ncbi:hypothetical protein AX15_000762 [Amanita polypyramis BW_CC]|nr:hypothetical protein AX15_000762 [Amanita polypyramis BW_CC]
MQSAPLEIIHEVIKYLATPMVVIESSPSFPWYLGQICATWRNAFVGAPWMWNRMEIEVLPFTSRQGVLQLVELCIERSGNHPLCLYVSQPYTEGVCAPANKVNEQILAALVAESSRWHSVELDYSLMEFFHRNSTTSFPLLRSLRLHHDDYVMKHEELSDLFMNSPQLTELQLDSIPELNFDWSLLTTLCLDGSDLGDVRRILRQLHSLVRLVIGAPFVAPDANANFPEPEAVIVLPRLRVLRLYGEMMRYLEAPALEELHVTTPADVIVPFLQRSSHNSTLRKLIIDSFSVTLTRQILELVPEITHLCIHVAQGPATDVARLLLARQELLRDQGMVLVPNLQLLVISYYWYNEQMDGLMTDLSVVANTRSMGRAPSVKKLRELSLPWQPIRLLASISSSRLMYCCEQNDIKLSTFGHVPDHRWCTTGRDCVFELCDNNFVMRALHNKV